MTETLKISSTSLSASVAVLGAELQDLRDAEGRDLLWTGDPAVWSGRAPVLFPIVGELAGGRYRLGERTYTLGRHGFARRAPFAVVAHAHDRVVLRLDADDATRAVYPFAFRLELSYVLVEAELRVTATVANRGDAPMPASLGFHPGFRWPLPYGQPREDHVVRFEHDEPAPIRRLDAKGLVLAEPQPTPVVGDTLVLRDALFDDDALVFDRLSSRRVSYGASRGPRLDIAYDLPSLGVWTKPGGSAFICIEPWQGTADPVGFDGDIFAKPGIVTIAPDEARTFSLTIALVDDR